MRQSIVDGIEQVYEDATEKGDTNMEVARARGSESSLNDRLDKNDTTHKEVTAQLAHKVGGGKKAELEDLSGNVLSAIEGGLGTEFNLLSIPQQKSVGMAETKYPMAEGAPSKNIFQGWEKGSFDWTTGAPVVSTSKIRSVDFMKVVPNEYIWINDPESQGTTTANVQTLFEFDINKNFIKYVAVNTFKSRGYLPSANCHFITVQSQTEGAGGYVIGSYSNFKTQIEYNTKFTGYESPFPKTKPLVFTGIKTVDKKNENVSNTITNAANSSLDDRDNPVTININPGIYNESVQIRGDRYLSLVGTNKKDCVIQTNTGLYEDAPLEIAGEAYVANLSLIANYETFPTELTGNKAYALHVDYSGEGTTEFENCYFKSSLTSALGLGTHENQKIIFRNSKFESDTDSSLQYAKYGAAFLHASTVPDAQNQKVEFHNCEFNSINETVMWLADVNGSSTIEVGFYNCKLWSEINGNADSIVAIFGSKVIISPDSYGNNVAKLNK